MIELLKGGAVGVLPTDTLYGLVGSALSTETVDRIYRLKDRDRAKPSIILIGDIKQLDLFGISDTDKQRSNQYWPGPVSLILPSADKSFRYLDRGTSSLAFRLPDKQQLWQLLEKTGPLIASSANLQGKAPARTIKDAKDYFGDRIDFYVEGGKLSSRPSKLISLLSETPKILRAG